MERKIIEFLKGWKDDVNRKPLLLQGARHVGKTYTALEFGRTCYENVAYFNFETDPKFIMIFEESTDPGYLIPIMSRISGQTIIKGKTLIIFDEIQHCEKAVASLKAFSERAPEYHLLAIGRMVERVASRQGIFLSDDTVVRKTMYPMDFEEFLIARGEKPLRDLIRFSFERNQPLPLVLHEAAMGYYRQYLVIGGMPTCVEKFLETRDPILVRHMQATLLYQNVKEMEGFIRNADAKKTRLIYENLDVQLSKKSTRFQYRSLKKGGRSSEFEGAIHWLTDSGLVLKVPMVRPPRESQEGKMDEDAFKLFFSDIGLLCARKDLTSEDLLYLSEQQSDFKGGMTENYVCQQLTANGHFCCFWQSERGAEVDFVVRCQDGIIPIQVKSADNSKAKSLQQYLKQYDPPYGIKLSSKNFAFDNGKKTVPLYGAFCI